MKTGSGNNGYDAGVLSNPLSLLRSGYLVWYFGGSGGRADGYYWLLQSSGTTTSNYLSYSDADLNPHYSSGIHGNGYAVRCVQILHHSH